MLLAVRDVRLVCGLAPGAHLGQSHHHFQHVHVPDDLDQLGGRAAADQGQDLLPGHVNVDQHAGDILGRCVCRLPGHVHVDRVLGDEMVDQIECLSGHAIHLDHHAVVDADAGLGVERAVHRCQPDLGPGMDKGFLVHGALGEVFKAF